MQQLQHVIVGAGVLGRSLARSLAERGERPVVLSRSGASGEGFDGKACDVSNGTQLAEHLNGPTRLYLCAAPAYWRWAEEFPALVDGVTAACAGRRVDIVYADNLYGLGEGTQTLREDSPYRPCSKKGAIRRDAAERLLGLHGRGELRTTIVRAADFFGPGVEASIVGRAVIAGLLSGKTAYLLGRTDQPHAITYVPDFANALHAIAAHDDAYGRAWHAPTQVLPSLAWLAERIAEHGGHAPKVSVPGPLMMRMIGVFSPAMRELREMLYQFDRPFLVSSDETCARFSLAATAIETAIADTVAAFKRAA